MGPSSDTSSEMIKGTQSSMDANHGFCREFQSLLQGGWFQLWDHASLISENKHRGPERWSSALTPPLAIVTNSAAVPTRDVTALPPAPAF